jgi:hypothetical protein
MTSLWKNSSKPLRTFTESPKLKASKSTLAPNPQTSNPNKNPSKKKLPNPTLTKATQRKKDLTWKKSCNSTRSMRYLKWCRKKSAMVT